MKIIQIDTSGTTIYGLGDDGILYQWNPSLRVWVEV